MTVKYHSLDFAFAKLMEIWKQLPRSYREKYAVARSKHFNAEIGIGLSMKCKMLQEAGFIGTWHKEEPKGGIL